jgi:hypothetical protein
VSGKGAPRVSAHLATETHAFQSPPIEAAEADSAESGVSAYLATETHAFQSPPIEAVGADSGESAAGDFHPMNK